MRDFPAIRFPAIRRSMLAMAGGALLMAVIYSLLLAIGVIELPIVHAGVM